MLFNLNLNFCLTDQCFSQSMRKNRYHLQLAQALAYEEHQCHNSLLAKRWEGFEKKINFVEINKQ